MKIAKTSVLCIALASTLFSISLQAAENQPEPAPQENNPISESSKTDDKLETMPKADQTSATSMTEPAKSAELGRYQIAVGLNGGGYGGAGYMASMGIKVLSLEDRDFEQGIYLIASAGQATSNYRDTKDSTTTFDYEARYRRHFQQVMLAYESFTQWQNVGFHLGAGYRKEKGQVERDYSRQEPIPVFFGSQSRTVDQSKEASDSFEKNVLVASAGIFLQQKSNLSFLEGTQIRVGSNLTLPYYGDGKYKIRTPEGNEQTHSLSDRPILGITWNLYASWIL